MKGKNIHKLIDLYFDAQLSRAEEEELFRYLLHFKGEDQKVDEALAVMLTTRMPIGSKLSRSKSKQIRHSRLRRFQSAAAIALIVAAGATALWHHSNKSDSDEIEGMIAYVSGVKISDQSEIMKIVDDQLNDIGMSSELFAQTIAEDLDDIRDAFNEEGI